MVSTSMPNVIKATGAPRQYRVRSNLQGETQLLAEWLTRNGYGPRAKTHVFLNDAVLVPGVSPPTPASAMGAAVFGHWMDCRIAFDAEVWVVEAKLVGEPTAYGQAYYYAQLYPQAVDSYQFAGRAIVPVVLCARANPHVQAVFGRLGVRTIIFQPAWADGKIAAGGFGSTSQL